MSLCIFHCEAAFSAADPSEHKSYRSPIRLVHRSPLGNDAVALNGGIFKLGSFAFGGKSPCRQIERSPALPSKLDQAQIGIWPVS
jgi:hypothetical protein